MAYKRVSTFSALSKPIDITNEELIQHRRARVIPLSLSPFVDGPVRRNRLGSYDVDEKALLEAEVYDPKSDEEVGERPPAWLDLFYDLAWAATFANLTQNTVISTAATATSYSAFFTIAYWMWVTQVAYDVKFYTNDWFHRCMMFLQLSLYGALAAFTQNFDLTAFITHAPTGQLGATQGTVGFLGLSSNPEAAARRYADIQFEGIALILALSRTLLLIQYLVVLKYAGRQRNWRFYAIAGSLFVSAVLFYISFAYISAKYSDRTGAIVKYIFWGTALFVELCGYAVFKPPTNLRSTGSLTGRLGTLVTIILGEGINSISGSFQFLVQGFEFNFKVAAQLGCTAVIVYMTFYLYFESSRPRLSRNRRQTWIMLHLPYLLFVLLLLEGLKNILIWSGLLQSLQFVLNGMGESISAAFDNADEGSNPITLLGNANSTLTPLLDKLGLSWPIELQKLVDFTKEKNTTLTPDDLFVVGYQRLILKVVLNVFAPFVALNSLDNGIQAQIVWYQTNDTAVLQDAWNDTSSPNLEKVVDAIAAPQVQSARSIMALCGGTLVFLALLNVTQAWPKDRYAWGSFLSRLTMGLILTALLALNIGSNQDYSLDEDSNGPPVWRWLDDLWAIPTLAIALGLQGVIDHVLLHYAVKAADAAAPVDPIFSSESGYPLQKLHTAESDYSYNPVSPGTAKEDEAFENESSRLKTMWNK